MTPSAIPTRLNFPRSDSAGLPFEFLWACRRCHLRLTTFVLVVKVSQQQVCLFQRIQPYSAVQSSWSHLTCPTGLSQRLYQFRRRFVASTSRYGTGQQSGSYQTPLGLHRVREKIGDGYPVGTVFESRRPVGFTWQGKPDAAIAHRILWLEGLEPGVNAGGNVDSHSRYIYIHGVGNELTLGRPSSRGCIHLAAADLIGIFDRLPTRTLVWISE